MPQFGKRQKIVVNKSEHLKWAKFMATQRT